MWVDTVQPLNFICNDCNFKCLVARSKLKSFTECNVKCSANFLCKDIDVTMKHSGIIFQLGYNLVTLVTLSPPSFIPIVLNILPPFIYCSQELIIKRFRIQCDMTIYILAKGYTIPGNQGTHDKSNQIRCYNRWDKTFKAKGILRYLINKWKMN